MTEFVLLCAPSYRIHFLMELSRMARVRYWIGDRSFSEALPICDEVDLHRKGLDARLVKNVFVARRTFMFQKGLFSLLWTDNRVIVPLGPKILSSWIILAVRALMRKPTLVYGHAFGRLGHNSKGNALRLLQVIISRGAFVYTKTEAARLRQIVPFFSPIIGVGNSSVSSAKCRSVGLSMRAGVLRLIYVGRLVAEKNVGLLSKLAWQLEERGLAHEIKIVGDGNERAALESALLGRQRRFGRYKFYGWQWSDEVLESLYHDSDVAISPGYVGLSAVQAFAKGVPMVIANVANHAPELEACIPGWNCEFFAVDPDCNELVSAILRIVQRQDEGVVRREDISAHIRVAYTFEGMAAKFCSVLASDRDQL